MEANDASSGSGDALVRARELRADLGARRDAESILAEAVKIRQDAARTAEALIAEAEHVAAQLAAQMHEDNERLEGEARQHAGALIARAQREADDILAEARVTAEEIRAAAMSDAEEHRRRVRAEVTAQVQRDLAGERDRVLREAERASALVSGRLVGALTTLGSSLESTSLEVAQALEQLPRPAADFSGRRVTGADDTEATDPGDSDDTTGSRAAETVRAAAAGDRPRSATEAFMTSSDDEVALAGRELEDLREADRLRRQRQDDARRAAQHRDVDGEQAYEEDNPRPLGWLFRSAP